MVDPTFFPGRAATIYYRKQVVLKTTMNSVKHTILGPEDLEIGVLGILHPSVLEKFEISFPCSAIEFSLEPFRKGTQKV